MARIRSIHPGFWTDEHVVSVSAFARLLLIGLGNESDDKGAFPWKPVMLKMRIFPVDNVDVAALLAELEAAELIKTYTEGTVKYGAIRNFRKHQSPRTPNDVHPMSDDLRIYVGLSVTNAEASGPKAPPVPQDAATPPSERDALSHNAEKCSEVEGRGGEKEKKDLRRKKISYSESFETFWKTFMADSRAVRGQSKEAAFIEWKKLSEEDRAQALAAIKPYQDECRKADQQLKHVERYLKKGVFRNYAAARINTANTVQVGTQEHAHLAAWKRERGLPVFDLMPIPEGYTPPKEQRT